MVNAFVCGMDLMNVVGGVHAIVSVFVNEFA